MANSKVKNAQKNKEESGHKSAFLYVLLVQG